MNGIAIDIFLNNKYREVTQSFAEVERLTVEALGDDSTFERGKSAGSNKIKAALMKRTEDRIGADMPDQPAEENEEQGIA